MGKGADNRPPDQPREPVRAASQRRLDPATLFALAVAATGLVFAVGLLPAREFHVVAHPTAGYLVYAALVVAGELFVLRLPARSNEVLLSASSIFAYAVAIHYGPGAAVVALCLGALIKGIVARRPAIKTAFNVAQHGITVGVAGLVYHHLGGSTTVGLGDVPLALVGAVVYLAVNYTLTEVVVALATGTRVRTQLVRGVGVWLPVEGVMLAFAPIVPIVSTRSLFMIPLLLLPFLGVFYSARIAVKAEHDSLHDALTGLPNRVLFRLRVEQALTRNRHIGGDVVVMVLDLDNFKEVNDALGHGRGDDLLRAISERLTRALREADVVARLGGDEFGVVLTTTVSEPKSPELIATRILDALETPFQLGDLWVNAATSIGIASSPEHGTDAERLIQRADVAMYLAKAAGSGFEHYEAGRDPNRPDNLRLLQELREGIERGELVLHYQPKVLIPDQTVIGVEALARWNHPRRGLLMPADFIELAERTELVRSLTLSVVRQAARQAVAWMERGIRMPVAVNLSPRVLLDVVLPTDIATVLNEEGLSGDMLEIEITESCLISDPVRSAEVLCRLSETGVRISIDDFGTGYSSLALLKSLPVDAIKIDRSFVRNLATDSNDKVIVESTIKLSTGLGLRAVAEGIENEEAWNLLAGYQCDEGQGFHICRPLPPNELLEWMLEAGVGSSPDPVTTRR